MPSKDSTQMIKNTVILVGSIILSTQGFAQDTPKIESVKKDSINIPKKVATYAADKFTIIRPLNIEFSNGSPYNFSPKKGIPSLKEGKVEDFKQVKVSANFNFIARKNWVFGATLGYKYTHMESDLLSASARQKTTMQQDFHHHFTSLNFAYFSTLFGKRAIFTSSVIVDGSEEHFERVKGLVSGIIVLKADAKTKMSVGLVGNIDPTSQVPVLPVFTYEYKFNNGLIFDVTLPKSVYLRKHLFSTGRLSLGTEMEQTSFYLYNLEETKQRYEYRQLDINSGLIYEYALGDFILTAKGGLKVTPSAKIFEKEESFNHAAIEVRPDPSFYFTIGVSFNPFTLLKKQ